MTYESIYLYRRKGLSDYATCNRTRYVELSQNKLFETMTCYTSDLQQRLADAERRNVALLELVQDVSESVVGRNGTFARIPADWFDKRDAALNKPEEAKS